MLPGVAIMATPIATDPVEVVYESAVALVAQGAKRSVFGGGEFDYRAGQYLLVPIDLPVTGLVIEASPEAPFLAMGLAIQPAIVAALLLESEIGEPLPVQYPQATINTADEDLLDAFARLLRLLDHPEEVPIMRPMIEREILWRLLRSTHGGMLRQIGVADSHLSRISRTTRWIRGNYAKTLRIEELADIAGMSPTSFHRHFRALTTMSPLQYQKQIRLQQARMLLMNESSDVATIGSDVGYDSPSQFSREYARLFGNSPRKDVLRLKSLAG
jgi:AraC-like DNA-binding protein